MESDFSSPSMYSKRILITAPLLVQFWVKDRLLSMTIFPQRDMRLTGWRASVLKKKKKKNQAFGSGCAKAAAYINTHTHINQMKKALCACWGMGMKLGFLGLGQDQAWLARAGLGKDSGWVLGVINHSPVTWAHHRIQSRKEWEMNEWDVSDCSLLFSPF